MDCMGQDHCCFCTRWCPDYTLDQWRHWCICTGTIQANPGKMTSTRCNIRQKTSTLPYLRIHWCLFRKEIRSNLLSMRKILWNVLIFLMRFSPLLFLLLLLLLLLLFLIFHLLLLFLLPLSSFSSSSCCRFSSFSFSSRIAKNNQLTRQLRNTRYLFGTNSDSLVRCCNHWDTIHCYDMGCLVCKHLLADCRADLSE